MAPCMPSHCASLLLPRRCTLHPRPTSAAFPHTPMHDPHPCRVQEFEKFGRGVAAFAGVGLPAAIVNSGLKFMTKAIELAFQQRLDLYLHKEYTSNRWGGGLQSSGVQPTRQRERVLRLDRGGWPAVPSSGCRSSAGGAAAVVMTTVPALLCAS